MTAAQAWKGSHPVLGNLSLRSNNEAPMKIVKLNEHANVTPPK